MHISHGTIVLVTDGRKMLLLRNDGDAEYPMLTAVEKAEEESPPDRALKSDRAGHTNFAGARRGSALGECDFHRQQETRFAHDAADLLNRMAEADELDRLIVVADPRTLGTLRSHYGKALAQRIVGEVGKDLVKHPVGAIERILQDT